MVSECDLMGGSAAVLYCDTKPNPSCGIYIVLQQYSIMTNAVRSVSTGGVYCTVECCTGRPAKIHSAHSAACSHLQHRTRIDCARKDAADDAVCSPFTQRPQHRSDRRVSAPSLDCSFLFLLPSSSQVSNLLSRCTSLVHSTRHIFRTPPLT